MKGWSCLAAIAAAAVVFSGCSGGGSIYSNLREIEKLQIIQTMGFDMAQGRVTVSISSGPAQGELPSVKLAAEGDSISQALDHLQDWAAREELFFAHVRFVVIGEQAAREGLADVLDFFQRNTQTRLALPVFIVRGGTARELVTCPGDDLYEITSILSSVQRDTEKQGSAHCFTLLDIAQRLARSGAALCCTVTAAQTGENVPSAQEGTVTALETGYAVLQDGRLAFWLDREETQGANLLLGLAGSESVTLPDGQGGQTTLELSGSRASVRPLPGPDGALGAAVELSCQAGVVQAAGGDVPSPETLAGLDRELTGWLEARVLAALEAARRTGADFLELGRTLRLCDPRAFDAAGWDGVPADLRWTLEVQGSVRRSFEMEGAADTGGEGRDHV